MPHTEIPRLELVDLLEAYFRGEKSLEDYLTWEVEFTTGVNADANPRLTQQAGGLALLGHESLMSIRPLSDFENEARVVLVQLRRPTVASPEAAGG